VYPSSSNNSGKRFAYHHARHQALHSLPTRRSSDLEKARSEPHHRRHPARIANRHPHRLQLRVVSLVAVDVAEQAEVVSCPQAIQDRKSTRLNSSHDQISYAVFCLKKKSRRSVRLAS